MPTKNPTTTVRVEIADHHKFEDLRRHYERRHYEATGIARRLNHAEVMRMLLEEPHVREKWQDGGRVRRLA